MLPYALAYGTAALAFLALDAVWLTAMGDRFYKPLMGGMALEGFRLAPAIAFYLIYVTGILVFAIQPAFGTGRWTTALLYGAAFGFCAYATYDLTNQATLKAWPLALTLVDLAWGTVLTACAATAGFLGARALAG
ncbi:membrane protein [Azorhizobium oxalatiphilum]|uniref:Membrane protein n=1 Tax=Azorhizobium oxalatiphilum TaxID=980631 RepID=A0A917BY47_9HYPH|nr:DUF2177 family protein [Azorhizobium oxalatiphilum]GGF61151.1 membrane protein [Azorhizobium oxalatiphilum]